MSDDLSEGDRNGVSFLTSSLFAVTVLGYQHHLGSISASNRMEKPSRFAQKNGILLYCRTPLFKKFKILNLNALIKKFQTILIIKVIKGFFAVE